METDSITKSFAAALHSWPAQESAALNVCRLLRIDELAGRRGQRP
jgi:hypothetical protein